MNNTTFIMKNKISKYTVIILWYILTDLWVFMALEEFPYANQAGIFFTIQDWFIEIPAEYVAVISAVIAGKPYEWVAFIPGSVAALIYLYSFMCALIPCNFLILNKIKNKKIRYKNTFSYRIKTFLYIIVYMVIILGSTIGCGFFILPFVSSCSNFLLRYFILLMFAPSTLVAYSLTFVTYKFNFYELLPPIMLGNLMILSDWIFSRICSQFSFFIMKSKTKYHYDYLPFYTSFGQIMNLLSLLQQNKDN